MITEENLDGENREVRFVFFEFLKYLKRRKRKIKKDKRERELTSKRRCTMSVRTAVWKG